MGTSVGSRALTLRRAVVLAAVFEFAGAYLVGSNVSETIRKKVFDPQMFEVVFGAQASVVLACGMIAALLAAGSWLLFATYFGWPVSTTHSIVGAVVGVGATALGAGQVAWSKVGIITAGWIVSPVLSGAAAYLLFRILLSKVYYQRDPLTAAKRFAPYIVFLVVLVLVGVGAFKGLKPSWHRWGIDPFSRQVVLGTLGVALVLGTAAFFVARRLLARITEGTSVCNPIGYAEAARSLGKVIVHLRRVRETCNGGLSEQAGLLIRQAKQLREQTLAEVEQFSSEARWHAVERVFVPVQVMTACFVAFAHGSNDVANAVGPLSAAVQALTSHSVRMTAGVPAWVLALGGVGIVIGLATWGWRVMKTVGEKITELTPSRGFCAEFAAAIVILVASVMPLGLPISTTHTLVGAVLGVGLARGLTALNLSVARTILASWVVTIPAGAILASLFYLLLRVLVG
ncbi:MAG: inorganic phosphate transporter [Deltaproteobacteria bacterium]|nr:MAG: inorganic phosphate transporter [Deltaproteobacteria bacterium]